MVGSPAWDLETSAVGWERLYNQESWSLGGAVKCEVNEEPKRRMRRTYIMGSNLPRLRFGFMCISYGKAEYRELQ